MNDTLTPDDAVDVMEELLPAQNKSYELGLKFKLPHHDVESIHSVYSKPRSRLLHILIGFTSQTEPRPTWRVIIEALRSPAVDEPALARRVEAAHFPDPTATRDVVAAFQKNQASPPLQGGVRMMQRHQALAAGQGQALLFNEMLFKIAQSLSARDVESLTYTLCNSLLGMSADRVSSVTQLFQLLQQRQIVTPTNLQALYNELENIGRSDLSKLINNYLIEIGRPPCQPGRDEGELEKGEIYSLPRFPSGQKSDFLGSLLVFIPEINSLCTYFSKVDAMKTVVCHVRTIVFCVGGSKAPSVLYLP